MRINLALCVQAEGRNSPARTPGLRVTIAKIGFECPPEAQAITRQAPVLSFASPPVTASSTIFLTSVLLSHSSHLQL